MGGMGVCGGVKGWERGVVGGLAERCNVCKDRGGWDPSILFLGILRQINILG